MKCILIHGLGQTSLSWEKTRGLLSGEIDADCIELFSQNNEKINYLNIYNEFVGFCKTYNEPFNICGLSFGGILALHYAINNPDKVNSMILIGAQYKMPKLLLKLQNIIFTLLPESQFNGLGIKKKEMIALTKSMMNLNFKQELCKIKCPVLVVCGEKDRTNIKASIELSKKISSAKLCIVPESGHEVNKDNPVELAKILNDFLVN